ncbi:MAG: exo-alpha-sialidase [Actinomycetota bacterium]|nr:exo-alpha-sialidase [Actinomycetota bacterium]
MTTLAVGTDKGGWLLRSDDRHSWQVDGPFFSGWGVTAFGRAADGAYLAATNSGWFGPGVHRSRDLDTWEQVADGPAFGDSGPRLEQIWTFTTAPDGRLYCGVAEAGVFVSDDHGGTWQPVTAFNAHATRPAWQPGGGGLCAHRVLLDGDRMWVAASAVGVFRSDDAGATFVPRNAGVQVAAPDGGDTGVGYCVHALTTDPANPDVIWRQDHRGVYRTADGGDSWERIERGLPAAFGFPIVRDNASGALFVVPLAADENRVPVDGRFAAWRSLDGGDSWSLAGTGWPDEPSYASVLRGAVATDGDGGVYLGSTGGELWATADAGDTWQRLPGRYPRIATVAVI